LPSGSLPFEDLTNFGGGETNGKFGTVGIELVREIWDIMGVLL